MVHSLRSSAAGFYFGKMAEINLFHEILKISAKSQLKKGDFSPKECESIIALVDSKQDENIEVARIILTKNDDGE